jgi:hypothetical protein
MRTHTQQHQDTHNVLPLSSLLPPAPLVRRIWGEGPERERLTALGVELGLAARLQWMGATESPEEALSQVVA